MNFFLKQRAYTTKCLIRFFLFLIIAILLSGSLFASDKKKALVISSYHKGYDWSDGEIQGIEHVFYPLRNSVDLSVEYMDTKRIRTPEYEKLYLEMLKLKYDNYKPDVIIALDDNAFRFIIKFCEYVFGEDVPVVFAGVNDFTPDMIENHHHHITGLVQNMDLEENIELALKFYPEANPVVVVTDDSTSGIIYTEQLRKIEANYKDRKFIFINTSHLTYDEMIDKIKNQTSSSVGLLLAYTQNKDRRFIQTQKGFETISSEADFPFFGVLDMAVRSGALGGKVKYGFQHGKEAAEIALKILNGAKISEIPVKPESRNTYMFNFRQMSRFHIGKHQLPPGSIIINEPESFYYRYKKEIWIVVFTFFFLVISIVVLSINVSRRKEVERKLRIHQNQLKELVDERTSELRTANKALTEALEQLKQTQSQLVEKEKMAALGNLVAGVAHQINTPAGIAITASSYLVDEINKYEKLYRSSNLKKSEMEELINVTVESSNLILGNMRRISSLIETFKMVASVNGIEQMETVNIKSLLAKIAENPGFDFEINRHKIIVRCADDVEVKSFPSVITGILKNLISNSVQHGFKNSREGTIFIDAVVERSELNLHFRDNGKGINKDDLKHIFEPFRNIRGESGGIGLGLHIVYNLVVHNLKGKIVCNSEKEKGCEFIIAIPLG